MASIVYAKPTEKFLAVIQTEMGSDHIVLTNEEGQIVVTLPNPKISSVIFDQLSWSDSGEYLAAGYYDLGNAIYGVVLYDLHDLQNIPSPRVYNGGGFTFSPVWHDNTLAMIRQKDGQESIWAITLGAGIEKVSDDFPTITDIAWSPDGSQIAFACSQDRTWEDVNSTELPSDIHICLSSLNTHTTSSITGSTGARYPFWFHKTLSWIYGETVVSSGKTIVDQKELNQIGSPTVNGNDIYLSTLRFFPTADTNMWVTVKFTCSAGSCVKSDIQYINAYQLSLSRHGLIAYQSIYDGFSTVVIRGYDNVFTLINSKTLQYSQPVWQP